MLINNPPSSSILNMLLINSEVGIINTFSCLLPEFAALKMESVFHFILFSRPSDFLLLLWSGEGFSSSSSPACWLGFCIHKTTTTVFAEPEEEVGGNDETRNWKFSANRWSIVGWSSILMSVLH